MVLGEYNSDVTRECLIVTTLGRPSDRTQGAPVGITTFRLISKFVRLFCSYC